MEWTKVKVKHFASNNLTKSQKGTLITLIVNTAMLERMPTSKEIEQIVGKVSVSSVQNVLETLGDSVQNVLEKVLEDVEKLRKSKNTSCGTSARYRERHEKVTRHVAMSCDTTEKRREEKRREDSSTNTKASRLTDADFLTFIKNNSAYSGINIDAELAKMDAWLMTRPGRQKTQRFIINWLNKVDKPLQAQMKERPKI
jgi:hypothetical protein